MQLKKFVLSAGVAKLWDVPTT